MAVLSTVITGTVLATGKTFTHGLGTTPDFIHVQNEHGSTGASIGGMAVHTFNTQIMVIAGVADGATFRALVIKIHSFQL